MPPTKGLRLLLPLLLILVLVGYLGPWIPHEAAGLVISGLDLGEVVKFLPPPDEGEDVWRQSFYLPLVAIAAAAVLYAYRSEMHFSRPVRIALLLLSGVAALNLLPPAWTPARLISPEFRLQTVTMLLLLALATLSPILAFLPRKVPALLLIALSFSALFAMAMGFQALLPRLSQLYGRALAPGWGFWLHMGSLSALALFALTQLFPLSRSSGKENPA